MSNLENIKRFKNAYPEMEGLDDTVISRYLRNMKKEKKKLDNKIRIRVKQWSKRKDTMCKCGHCGSYNSVPMKYDSFFCADCGSGNWM